MVQSGIDVVCFERRDVCRTHFSLVKPVMTPEGGTLSRQGLETESRLWVLRFRVHERD
jgi:hypothetical protein